MFLGQKYRLVGFGFTKCGANSSMHHGFEHALWDVRQPAEPDGPPPWGRSTLATITLGGHVENVCKELG